MGGPDDTGIKQNPGALACPTGIDKRHTQSRWVSAGDRHRQPMGLGRDGRHARPTADHASPESSAGPRLDTSAGVRPIKFLRRSRSRSFRPASRIASAGNPQTIPPGFNTGDRPQAEMRGTPNSIQIKRVDLRLAARAVDYGREQGLRSAGPFGETTARTTRLVAEFATGDALRRRIRRPSRVRLVSRAPAGSQAA